MVMVTAQPATQPPGMSPKQWTKIVEKHGKKTPHFQTGSPKAGAKHKEGTTSTTPKFENVNDTSHQIQQLPTTQSAQEKAAQDAAKVEERKELAQKAGFDWNEKTANATTHQTHKSNIKGMSSKGAVAHLGKTKNPSVCKTALMPSGRQGGQKHF